MNIPILYSDHSLIICEKPVGIACESPGIPELIREQTGFPVWPVHRLDAGTGGVLILARSRNACSAMQNVMAQYKVRKEYLSVVEGKPTSASGIYKDLLFHDRVNNKSYIVSRMRSGVKEAVCEWKMLESLSYRSHDFTLVRIILHTGRTHQIRIQFGSRKLPLIGDGKYGSRIKAGTPALWAYHVSFPHPFDKDLTVDVSSVPPDIFPWNLFYLEEL